jgi:signal transduction histidine kinase
VPQHTFALSSEITPTLSNTPDETGAPPGVLGSELISHVAHELRTPLTTILTWTHMMRSRAKDAWELRAAEILDRNARLEARLVDDLLDVARIADGRLRLDPTSCDLVALVRAAVDLQRPCAEAKQVALAIDLPETLRADRIDGPRLQQVFAQLISNAVKASAPEGTVRVTLTSAHDQICFSVRDEGCGIPAELLPSAVFEGWRAQTLTPSWQTASKGMRGLGVGLYIARHLVQLHGGTVTAGSDGPGLGATFSVSLPLPRSV